ncbi:MAG: flippase [Actinomycetota bacterium]|nr:flippase [Actinomycetota bacterium]
MDQDPEQPGDHSLSAEAAADVHTVTSGGGVQIAGQLSARGVSMLFTFIAIRVLGNAGYGLYRLVSQVLAIAGQLGLAGFNYAAMRWIAKARAAGDHGGVRGAARVGFAGMGIASAVVTILFVVFAGELAAGFESDPGRQVELANLFRIGAAYIPLFAAMQVLRYCTQAYRTMVPSVIVGNIIQPLTRFVLGVGALALGLAVTGAVSTLVMSTGLAAIAGVWYYQRILTAEERAATPHSKPGEMVRFALPQSGASLLGIQALGLGVIILGVLRSNREVGLFGLALSMQGPGGVFLSGILNIWAPVVSDLHHKGEMDRLESLYKTITRWVATFSFPIFAALILEPDLFTWITGGTKALDAAPVVAILAAGNFFYTGSGPSGYVLSMTGRPTVNFLNSLGGVILYAGLGFWLVPRHGIVGMAVVDAVVTALVNIAKVIEVKILVGVQPFGRSFLKPVIATIAGAAALLAWRLVPGNDRWLEALGVAVAAVVYVVVLRSMGLDAEERHVWDRIRRRVSRSGRKRR